MSKINWSKTEHERVDGTKMRLLTNEGSDKLYPHILYPVGCSDLYAYTEKGVYRTDGARCPTDLKPTPHEPVALWAFIASGRVCLQADTLDELREKLRAFQGGQFKLCPKTDAILRIVYTPGDGL